MELCLNVFLWSINLIFRLRLRTFPPCSAWTFFRGRNIRKIEKDKTVSEAFESLGVELGLIELGIPPKESNEEEKCLV